MAAALIPILLEAYNNSLKFADSVTNKFDEKRFAEAVTQMYGREPTYAELDACIEIIKTDTTISTKEKIDMLRALSKERDEYRDKEFEKKLKYADKVNESNQSKADAAVKVAMGVMSGGVTLLPEALKGVQGIKKIDEQNTPKDPGKMSD